MSRRAKVFLASSIALTTFTVWGVHYLQEREYQTMYQGVVKDDERVKRRALEKQQAAASAATSTTADGISVPNRSLLERQLEYERNLKLQEELGREQGLKKSEEERKRLEVERKMEMEASSGGGRI